MKNFNSIDSRWAVETNIKIWEISGTEEIILGVVFVFVFKGHVKIMLIPVIALSFPHFCPKLEQTLHIHQEQHS